MMFASRTPRDLNHDPHPWLDPEADPTRTPYWRAIYQMTGMVFSPRPEFDHVQHNPVNPILVEFRDYVTGATPESFAWSAGLWIDLLTGLGDPSFDAWHMLAALRPLPDEQIAHARRVLTRLANLAGEEI